MEPKLTEKLMQTIIGVHKHQAEQWIARFDELLKHCANKWSICFLEPYPPSYHFVVPVAFPDGSEAVLKLGVPSTEMNAEIETLRIYGGHGSVRLLEVEQERGILLLERLQPGLTLHSVKDDEEAVRIAAGVMRKIARPVPTEPKFPNVLDWAAGLGKMRARFDGGTGPLPERIAEKAERLYAMLGSTARNLLLLHGDLHHGNILAAEREPWLAIDPKGVIGEAEFGVIQFLFNNLPNDNVGAIIKRRIDLFAEELGLNRERIAAWMFCHAVLSAWWCVEGDDPDFEEAVHTAEIIEKLLS